MPAAGLLHGPKSVRQRELSSAAAMAALRRGRRWRCNRTRVAPPSVSSAALIFTPAVAAPVRRERLLVGGVAPRPIALVSSMDSKGQSNLSPFSFFNAFGVNPAVICFSPAYSGKTGQPKNTMENILETRECTVSIVTYDMVHQISL